MTLFELADYDLQNKAGKGSNDKNSGDESVTTSFFTELIPQTVKETIVEKAIEKAAEEKIPGRFDDMLMNPEQMRADNIFAKEAGDEDKIVLAFGGDILFDQSYSVMNMAISSGRDVVGSFSPDLLEYMRHVDVLTLNNEFPYSNGGSPTPEKQFTFRARPEYAEKLFDIGTDLVTLANNHMFDYGETALLDTLDTLDSISMPHIGAGRNLGEAARPVYFIVNDVKIGLINATEIERTEPADTRGATEDRSGVFRCLNDKKLLEEIAKMKENCDFSIVCIHWGTENETYPDWLQLEQAPEIANAGADLIIGAHPHCLQPIGYKGDTPVVYSLGNFWFNSKTIDTGLFEVTLGVDRNEAGNAMGTHLESMRFVPCLQQGYQTKLLQDAEKERVLSFMRSISSEAVIDAEGYVTRK